MRGPLREARTPDGLDPMETASADELAAVQLDRLKRTLRHAYDRIPSYGDAFTHNDVHPDDCRSLEDLRHFPFTTKDDLRQSYPFGMFAVPRERVARIHASSGTTGQPTVVGYTARDLDIWADLMARSMRAGGARPGDRVHVAYGYGLFTGGLGAHYGAERLGCTVIPVSGGMTERQVQLIIDFGPEVIMVTPSYMLVILDEFDRQGLRNHSLQVGIFGAEPWTEDMRREMEERAGIHAVDIYGISEVMGPGVANECFETKDGLHIWEDHFYPEIIDPTSGEPLPDGMYGELVLTSLTKEATPVIRYRTRDITRLLPGTARPMRRMERITGRSDDMMILRGVNLFPSQIEELVLGVPELAPHFQCVLTRPDRLDELTVKVELRPSHAGEAPDEVATRLRERIKNRIGLTVAVDVRAPGSVERSAGKARRVLDKRPKARRRTNPAR